MRIPFVNLALRHAECATDVEASVLAVLRSGQWTGGPTVGQAEASAAALLGRAGAVGVGSGTDALLLSLQAMHLSPGDEVIVPALTFFATAGAVLSLGANPVIADVREDGLLDERSAMQLRTERTRAVIPVHLFGGVADTPDLGVPVLHDGAQIIGADPPPSGGAAVTLSTYPTKTWGTAGDGGFVVSDDEDLLARVRALGNHGRVALPGSTYVHDRIAGWAGRASRLDAIQAAVLLAHAKVLPSRLARRRSLAARYDTGLPPAVRPLARPPGSAVHQYCVRIGDREGVMEALTARGIETAVYYPRPLQQQPALARCVAGPTPMADLLCRQLLALPIHDVDETAVDVVLEALWEVAA